MTDVLNRLERDTVIACVAMAGAAFAVWPDRPLRGLGVLGGGVLIGLSYWAIRGAVDTMVARVTEGRRPSGIALVKFFTRHAILAVAAYGMMARLHLDPVGMLAGVSAMGLAAGAEALRVLTGRSGVSPRRRKRRGGISG